VSVVEYLQERVESLRGAVEQLHRRIRAEEKSSGKTVVTRISLPPVMGQRRFQKVRKPSGRKPGGKHGHRGATLRVVDNPDIVEVQKVNRCKRCGILLVSDAGR
jgi:transposase